MKSILVLCILICFVRSDVLPDHLSNHICHRSNPNYTKCVKENFDKYGREFIKKGVPELDFPPLDPLEIPLVTADRTYNDLFSIKATFKNIRAVGASNIVIERMKLNPIKLTGQVRLNLPFLQVDTDYDGAGRLLSSPLKNKGHFSGNFSNIQVAVKGSLKLVEKPNGVAHFAMDKLFLKISVGDGHIKLTADNPDSQFEADLITNFFNDDPPGVLDTLNPLIVEYAIEGIRRAAAQVYERIPAKELLPE